jgi:YHS domain-containing protein
MSVDRSKGLELEVDGVTYYFCGPGCREHFAAEQTGPTSAGRPG